MRTNDGPRYVVCVGPRDSARILADCETLIAARQALAAERAGSNPYAVIRVGRPDAYTPGGWRWI